MLKLNNCVKFEYFLRKKKAFLIRVSNNPDTFWPGSFYNPASGFLILSYPIFLKSIFFLLKVYASTLDCGGRVLVFSGYKNDPTFKALGGIPSKSDNCFLGKT